MRGAFWVGLTDSEGAGAVVVALGAVVEVGVVVEVVVAGAFFSSPLVHEAVKPTIVPIAVPPAITATLRATRPDIMN